eukprot:5963051-Pleurochrysis_carterae.AAC.1
MRHDVARKRRDGAARPRGHATTAALAGSHGTLHAGGRMRARATRMRYSVGCEAASRRRWQTHLCASLSRGVHEGA